jgi:hypothetical protein
MQYMEWAFKIATGFVILRMMWLCDRQYKDLQQCKWAAQLMLSKDSSQAEVSMGKQLLINNTWTL